MLGEILKKWELVQTFIQFHEIDPAQENASSGKLKIAYCENGDANPWSDSLVGCYLVESQRTSSPESKGQGATIEAGPFEMRG